MAQPSQNSTQRAAANEPNPLLSVQIVHVDFCMVDGEDLLSQFAGASQEAPMGHREHTAQLPVIRIFGSTTRGQKACVHVHGAYPYFYFRPRGHENHGIWNDAVELQSLLPTIEQTIEQGVAALMSSRARSDQPRAKEVKVVKQLSVVQKCLFYGYHPEPVNLLRLKLFDPRNLSKVLAVLQSGVVMQTVFQAYEAHLPFLLQFFMDHHLYGMGFMHLAHAKFREPLPMQPSLSWATGDEENTPANQAAPQLFLNSTTPDHLRWKSTATQDTTAMSPTHPTRLPLSSSTPSPQASNTRSAAQILQAELLVQNLLSDLEPADLVWTQARDRLHHTSQAISSTVTKQSSCELELDVHVSQILNPQMSGSGIRPSPSTGTPGRINELVNVPSLAEVWREERERCNELGIATQPTTNVHAHSSAFPAINSAALQHIWDEHARVLKEVGESLSLATSAREARTPHTQRNPHDETVEDLLGWFQEQAALPTTPDQIKLSDAGQHPSQESDDCLSQPMPQRVNFSQSEIAQMIATQAVLGGDVGHAQSRAVEPHTVFSHDDLRDDHFMFSDEEEEPNEIHVAKELEDIIESSQHTTGTEIEVEENNEQHQNFATAAPRSSDIVRRGDDTPGERRISSGQTLASLFTPPNSQSRQQQMALALSPQPTISCGSIILRPVVRAPSTQHTTDRLLQLGVPPVVHRTPFYGKRSDVPNHATKFAGMTFHNKYLGDVPEFAPPLLPNVQSPSEKTDYLDQIKAALAVDRRFFPFRRCLAPVLSAPKPQNLTGWLPQDQVGDRRSATRVEMDVNTGQLRPAGAATTPAQRKVHSQISTPKRTPVSNATSAGGAHRMNITPVRSARRMMSRLTLMAIEVFAVSRKMLRPNPKQDGLSAICWAMRDVFGDSNQENHQEEQGAIIVLPPGEMADARPSGVRIDGLTPEVAVTYVCSEADLLSAFVAILVKKDPDFVMGYEIQKSSIGYLIERSKLLEPPVDLLRALGRMPLEEIDARNETDTYGQAHSSGIWLRGRTVLNLWRLMRSELKLARYSFQNVVATVLSRRVPDFLPEQLTRWFNCPATRWRTICHVVDRARMDLLLVDQLDLIRRTSEMARLFGIDFFSVLTRGSQYRVEAVMLRIVKAMDYAAISPTRKQVAQQAALEVIPLVMEPRSRFYVDPVVVLDFQSLYPSMMIAYNMCFSTILGKLANHAGEPRTTGKLGVIDYAEDEVARNLAGAAGVDAYIASNGTIFCSKDHREGVLPKMLREILDTRVMVKTAMKQHASGGTGGNVLERVLDARQFALKMIANVTYGYTAASFSGRMPMAELADAIVMTARSTLEAAIRLVHSTQRWGAKVVYGDTDSLFILLPGRSKEDAFRIGREIAQEVTARNPPPVILKFEKVFLPCILVTKKRYVGYSYESEQQKQAHLDAKGIEVVRRDQCPATVKMQESVLRTLFATKDLSQVKCYLYDQWTKILHGTAPLRDFIFSKEVKLGHYASEAHLPPAAIVASKAMLYDPMAEPRHAERVAYVVVAGEPGARLMDLVVDPYQLLRRGTSLRLNGLYYITKQLIPPLIRVLSLLGADVEQWFRDMPKPPPRLPPKPKQSSGGGRAKRARISHVITHYYLSARCEVCGELCRSSVCEQCVADGARAMAVTQYRLAHTMHAIDQLLAICRGCSGVLIAQPADTELVPDVEDLARSALNPPAHHVTDADGCMSLDCPVFFEHCRLLMRRDEQEGAVDAVFAALAKGHD